MSTQASQKNRVLLVQNPLLGIYASPSLRPSVFQEIFMLEALSFREDLFHALG